MNSFYLKFHVKWSDVDPNMHLRHSVYLDYTDQVRIKYFDTHGVSFLDFRQLQIGPILFSTKSDFRREVLLNEQVKVNCKLSMLSTDHRKWSVLHEIFKENGDLAATVTAKGAWMDLTKRKVIVPPERLIKIFERMEKTYDYSSLE